MRSGNETLSCAFVTTWTAGAGFGGQEPGVVAGEGFGGSVPPTPLLAVVAELLPETASTVRPAAAMRYLRGGGRG